MGHVVRSEHNDRLKTLGPQAAWLLTTLHERGRRCFNLREVAEVAGLSEASARSFARKLVERGVAARLRPGLFILVPFELGREREYLGNPYAVARELMGGRPYYVSHASAMELHGMLTRPQLAVYVTSPRPMRSRTVLGTEFRFVRCRWPAFFGTTERWIDKRETVVVSDLERTVLDGLRQPQLCGGFTEVAKGLWMRRADLDTRKLVDHALKLKVGAVVRRLGFLLEVYGVGPRGEIERLRPSLTASYATLDPLLPPEGKFVARWRLRVNVSPDELRAVVGT